MKNALKLPEPKPPASDGKNFFALKKGHFAIHLIIFRGKGFFMNKQQLMSSAAAVAAASLFVLPGTAIAQNRAPTPSNNNPRLTPEQVQTCAQRTAAAIVAPFNEVRDYYRQPRLTPTDQIAAREIYKEFSQGSLRPGSGDPTRDSAAIAAYSINVGFDANGNTHQLDPNRGLTLSDIQAHVQSMIERDPEWGPKMWLWCGEMLRDQGR